MNAIKQRAEKVVDGQPSLTMTVGDQPSLTMTVRDRSLCLSQRGLVEAESVDSAGTVFHRP